MTRGRDPIGRLTIAVLAMLTGVAGCDVDRSSGQGRAAAEAPAGPAESWQPLDLDAGALADVGPELHAAAADPGETPRMPASTAADESICRRMVRRIEEEARRYADAPHDFVRALNDEFTGGTSDPFEMRERLRTGRWNQEWFYAGHGGFRPEYDDAQRYPTGGNHQPGHFVAVLSIAVLYGPEAAGVAIAYAGDYNPGEEDDLRLSQEAIRLGAGLRDGALTPLDVAAGAAALCRSD